MAREDLHFRLRLPEELKQRVQRAADQNHRSMTAEILSRLDESFAIDHHIAEGKTADNDHHIVQIAVSEGARQALMLVSDLLDLDERKIDKQEVRKSIRSLLRGDYPTVLNIARADDSKGAK